MSLQNPQWPEWFIEKVKARRLDWLKWKIEKQVGSLAAEFVQLGPFGQEIWDMAVKVTLDELRKNGNFHKCSIAGDLHISCSVRMEEKKHSPMRAAYGGKFGDEK